MKRKNCQSTRNEREDKREVRGREKGAKEPEESSPSSQGGSEKKKKEENEDDAEGGER